MIHDPLEGPLFSAVTAIATSSPDSLQAYKEAIAEARTQTSTPSISDRRAIAAKRVPQPLRSKLFFD
jgi:isocitrate lyase